MRTRDILMLIAGMVVMLIVGWTWTYDVASPLGSDAPSTIDDKIRETRSALQERLDIDHVFALTGTQVSAADSGKHSQITFQNPRNDPGSIDADEAMFYTKTVSGVSEAFWMDENEAGIQITSGGYILGDSILDDSIDETEIAFTNNTYIKAVDNAGTGEVDLIKANTSDALVLKTGAVLSDSTAPSTDPMIANKKYVDDQITTAKTSAFTPTSYTGGETTTFPNGLIIKMGSRSGDGAVSFGTAFPNAIVSVVVTPNSATPSYQGPCVASVSAAGFTIDSDTNYTGAIYWIANGY